MSITYEQALGTLTAMFADPWTEDSLDTVLRHFEGHMENTVDAVLTHGDAEPQSLIARLESGANQEDLDAQLARELANGTPQLHNTNRIVGIGSSDSSSANSISSSNSRNGHGHGNTGTSSSNHQRLPAATSNNDSDRVSVGGSAFKQGRGIVTSLPEDFLRIPGNNIASDEALARMLQDKLFADELRNNPEFAHLAHRGRGGGQNRGAFPGMARGQQQQGDGADIMKALGSMGENAKKKLQELAMKVKNNIDNIDNGNGRRNIGPFSMNNGGVAERRGLLDLGEDDDNDDDEQEISFARAPSQQRTNYEMRDFDKKRD